MLYGGSDRPQGRRSPLRRDRFGLRKALKEDEKTKRRNGLRVRRLRLLAVLTGLAALAVISTVFGMMMAVAKDLPALEGRNEYRAAKNSVVLDAHGRKIGTLTGTRNRILVRSDQIAPSMKQAVVSIEDRRFYEHSGVDYRGIGRALLADARRQSAVQGASTITQQFVKNALQAQSKRTVMQKLREASLAYQLERNWSKDKILTQYLNAAYFGHGAYGIEAAARTYFKKTANSLTAAEAALIAGVIASPTLYDPVQNPEKSKSRRDIVLRRMRDQNMLTKFDYEAGIREPLPAADSIQRPSSNSKAPYFSDYLTQQLIDRYGSGATFGGGLRVRTTLDLDMQRLAEQTVNKYLAGLGPSAALVAINNKDGEVRAMVGGSNYRRQPYNLAVNAQRQPGSAFKPFTLISAFEQGISPNATFASKQLTLYGKGGGRYKVSNYEDNYLGSANLVSATVNSDNAVYVQLGQKVGTTKIAKTARKMGIETPISTNLAMVLGGLKQGVTTFQMTHAYETLARGGQRTSGTLAARRGGPVVIDEVENKNGKTVENNKTTTERVVPKAVANQVTGILQQVVSNGTAKKAAISNAGIAGKTGTTENHGDAWFCGYDRKLTVCIWVGYAKGPKPMLTEFGGSEVAGGTLPAIMFRSFMQAAISLRESRAEGKKNKGSLLEPTVAPQGSAPEVDSSKGGREPQKPNSSKRKPTPGKKNTGQEVTPTPQQQEATPPPAQPPTQGGATPPPQGGDGAAQGQAPPPAPGQ